MKPLNYRALAAPQVAPALTAQAHESLRPFTAYLKSAKLAAERRQERSVCRWERVQEEVRISLEPMDTLVAVKATSFGYRIAGWMEEAPEVPLFVGPSYRPVAPLRVEREAGAVVVWLDAPLARDELVAHWKMFAVLLTPITTWPSDLAAHRASGLEVPIRSRRETSGQFILVVEGREPVAISASGGRLATTELPPDEGATRLLADGFEVPWSGERTLMLDAAPTEDVLQANNGVRWKWSAGDGRRRSKGVWIQLLAPDDLDADTVVDPRAAYCEEGVREVRIKDSRSQPIKVFGSRRENYRLELSEYPPERSSLYVAANTAGLRRQRQATFRIKDAPLPHHRGLIRLCEDPGKVRWPDLRREPVTKWHLLADERWNGTEQQREFVEKALGTDDFAFLEGPPGSGKTHAICELVLQLIDRGKRVLLCSTTHVAVDNVLERLVGKYEAVEAVRIGRFDKVDQSVRHVQLDERMNHLVQVWGDAHAFPGLDEQSLKDAAESIVLGSVNLTCGTTTGILAHPYIRRADDSRDDAGGPRWPYFDVLILDEASKTTFSEFLVPAQLAKRWIIVGDVRQLPPFSEPKDLEASLREVSIEERSAHDGAQARTLTFPEVHQRALLILFRLMMSEAGFRKVRWVIEEPAQVIDALTQELIVRGEAGQVVPEFVRIASVRGPHLNGAVTLTELEGGATSALVVLAADWILLPTGLRDRAARFIPSDAMWLQTLEPGSDIAYRARHWQARHGEFSRPVFDNRREYSNASQLAEAQRAFLNEESWAKQLAWRIGRVHQLATARSKEQRERRQAEVETLMPAVASFSDWVPDAVAAIRDVGVRSVIESLRVPRSDARVRRRSALTEAIPEGEWKKRSVLLSYQHRMHPDISRYPRESFYDKSALIDANTLDGRDARVGWTFVPDAPARRVWVDVRGHEERGANAAEIEAMKSWLEAWRDHAIRNPRKDGRPWEVACLSFYNRQEIATRDMLRTLTGRRQGETRFELPNTTIACATVDRFQGREADLVLLSLRNTTRPGHMDSPNRLNVGITRARFLLAVFGHHSYFSSPRCRSDELFELANVKNTPLYTLPRAP